MPSVSVGMPAFNTGRYIAAAIESVLSQSYSAWELVIVDDGSTDDTGSIADAYAIRDPRIRVIHQAQSGISAARNRALEAADTHCPFIAFLDSDDVWYPDALDKLLRVLQTAHAAVGVHGLRTYIDHKGRTLAVDGSTVAPVRRRAVHHRRLIVIDRQAPTTFEVLAYGNCVFTGALLVRHDAIRSAGRFDSKATQAEDWDMWLRLTLQGPLAFVSEPVYQYRLHATNITRDAKQKNGALYYVRHKLTSDARLSAMARATVMAGFRWYELYRAYLSLRGAFNRRPPHALWDLPRIRHGSLSAFRHLSTACLPGRRRLGGLASDFLNTRTT